MLKKFIKEKYLKCFDFHFPYSEWSEHGAGLIKIFISPALFYPTTLRKFKVNLRVKKYLYKRHINALKQYTYEVYHFLLSSIHFNCIVKFRTTVFLTTCRSLKRFSFVTTITQVDFWTLFGFFFSYRRMETLLLRKNGEFI